MSEPDTRRILAGLFRRAPLIVACTLLTAGAALVFSLLQTKQYTADASLLFRDPGFDQRLFGSSVAAAPDPTREAATNITLVSLEAVADRTAAALGGGLTGDEISNKVSVQSEGQSDVASIKATDPDPQFAATLANAFAENYIAFRRDADRRKVQQARNLVEADFARLSPAAQQSGEGQSLQRQISRLSTLEALQTGNAELVQRATVPTSPSSPKTVRNTILGWILGLLLGVGLALLLERLRPPAAPAEGVRGDLRPAGADGGPREQVAGALGQRHGGAVGQRRAMPSRCSELGCATSTWIATSTPSW